MQSFTLSGPLYQAGTSNPLLDPTLLIRVQILNPSKTCVLYEEQQSVNTATTGGVFNIQVGSAAPNAKRSGADLGNPMALVFQNIAAIPGGDAAGATCATPYVPAPGATRYFRVIFTPTSTGTPDVMAPDIAMGSVPSALVAQSLQGLERGGVLQVRSDGSYSLTQANLETTFSAANFTKLQSLLSGTSSQYLTATSGATKSYADSSVGGKGLDVTGVGLGLGGGKTLIWDQTLNKFTATMLSSGSVSSVGAGLGLLGGPITSAGSLAVDVGTTALKIVQLNASAQLPAVDGSKLANVSAGKIQARNVASTAPSSGQVLAWNNAVSQWEPQTVAGGTGTSALAFVNGGNSFGATTTLGTTDGYALSLLAGGLSAVTIMPSGKVGIGTTNPAAALDVALGGSASAIIVPRDSTVNRPPVATNGMFRYNTTLGKIEAYENGSWVNFTTSSDARLKKNVVSIEHALNLVEAMRPVYFDWDQSNPKAVGYGEKHQVGFIAQELEKVLPEVVNQGGDGYRTVEYGKIVSVAIAAVRELSAENAELKKKLEQQERDLVEIKKRLGMP